ncbi:hypothetical protein GMORB2_5976 [Geosmithia morbida]|uniref:Uncharacterized protein n=1 Tax=Geosmithia morbida TaxID=1094350 RepID=A0A9P4YWQ5_9HYPO|nr:uncharacterized protein GMORB2_5976 [Geosmithia morbida]KAF4124260.1 hypothetical protein GMORB2_5976 [Geosmithia morbida]
MVSPPLTPTSVRSRRRLRDHDTGFPETLGGCLTTNLPHPDADLSPNACITCDTIGSEQADIRRQQSMLSKHRRTVSQGSTNTQTSAASQQLVHGVLPLISGMIPSAACPPASDETVNSSEGRTSAGDGGFSLSVPSSGYNNDGRPMTSGSIMSDTSKTSKGEKEDAEATA